MSAKDNQFGRIITLLRKEKGQSQKEAANNLGISQALLSHYEKGIRECGHEFIIKAAKYYDVSADYLLGISPNKAGAVIKADDIPDENMLGKENKLRGSILPTLNKRIILNSLNVLYDLLNEANSNELTKEISSYLFLAVYKMFRYTYSINKDNPQSFFAAEEDVFSDMERSAEGLCEMQIRCLTGIAKSRKIKAADIDTTKLSLNQEIIEKTYPMYASSLLNLIQNAESKMGARRK